MQTYTYIPLSPGEIRLLTLHSGAEGSRVRISLDNTQLRPSEQTKAVPRVSLNELQKTVPIGWLVWENLEGKIIFEHEDTEITSYTHPLEGFNKDLYSENAEDFMIRPSFEALSYTWGVEDDCIEVDVVKQQDLSRSVHGNLLIRPNLDAALRHLRYVDRPRTIWIDALCINQDDLQERNEQVRRMTDVYRGASRVIVWVGTTSDDSELALRTMNLLGQQLEWTRDGWRLCHPDAVYRDWFRSKTNLPFDSTTWRAFENLFQRPWFERLWIWQEVQLANKDSVLQCGSDCIEWATFRRATRRLYSEVEKSPSQFSTSFRSRNLHINNLVRNHTGLSLPKWIATAKGALCTDPKDRIYGLLGLASPEYARMLEPDYSLPIGEVYKSAVLAELSTSDNLTVLCHCNLQQQAIDAPSWVPDWSLEGATQNIGLKSGFLASGRSKSHAEHVPPSGLVAQGVKCGMVMSVTSPCQEDQLSDILSSWAPPQVHEGHYITDESLRDAFLMTLYGGQVADYTGYSGHPSLIDLRSAFFAHRESRVLPTDTVARSTDRINLRGSRWLLGRTLAATKEGYIGLAPYGTRVGDVVSVLLGSPMPMVLRPNLEGRHQIVGSGYFHGLMHGEGILGALPTGWMCRAAHTDANWSTESFFHQETRKSTFDDPRLHPLPSEWKIDTESTFSLRMTGFPKFVNQITGEVRETDPRLTPEAIRQRGVKLQPITLI